MTSPSRPAGFLVPLAQPRWSYLLLAINVLIWLAMGVVGWTRGAGLNGSQNAAILLDFGAQRNSLVAAGQYWRLLTSMFLHIGPMHLLFNSWALYVFGQDVERRYGGSRFIIIYLLSGLAGSLAFFWLGDDVPSAGASGAIFGLFGALIVYFAVHRQGFGQQGQQQLRSLLTLLGINLVIGVTVPGINILAHVGGLLIGALLGWLLAPDYALPSQPGIPAGQEWITMRDRNSLQRRLPAVLLVVLLLAAMGVAGSNRWANSPAVLLDQALEALDGGDYARAAGMLRSLSQQEPNQADLYFYLGFAEANLDNMDGAIQAWEELVVLQPDVAVGHWYLALAYQTVDRPQDAIAQLQAYVSLAESESERAQAEALILELSR